MLIKSIKARHSQNGNSKQIKEILKLRVLCMNCSRDIAKKAYARECTSSLLWSKPSKFMSNLARIGIVGLSIIGARCGQTCKALTVQYPPNSCEKLHMDHGFLRSTAQGHSMGRTPENYASQYEGHPNRSISSLPTRRKPEEVKVVLGQRMVRDRRAAV